MNKDRQSGGRAPARDPLSKNRLTKERRSWNVSRIRGKDTTPERIVRSLLHRLGYRFRLHVRIPIEGRVKLPLRPELAAQQRRPTSSVAAVYDRRGDAHRAPLQPRTPRAVSVDIVLPKHKTAIFIHGCFWHRHRGCRNCTTPPNRREWWLAKLEGNAARDKLQQAALRKLGWRVIVIWECEAECNDCLRVFRRQLRSWRRSGERHTSIQMTALCRDAATNPNGWTHSFPRVRPSRAFGCAKFLSPFPKRLKTVIQPGLATRARLERLPVWKGGATLGWLPKTENYLEV